MSSSGNLQSLPYYVTFVLRISAVENTIYKITVFHLEFI